MALYGTAKRLGQGVAAIAHATDRRFDARCCHVLTVAKALILRTVVTGLVALGLTVVQGLLQAKPVAMVR